MNVLEYIVQEGLVMIPALFLLGEMIKKTELMDVKLIPLIILPVSLLLTPGLLGGYYAENIVQAVLVAGIPTYGYEIWKNAKDAN